MSSSRRPGRTREERSRTATCRVWELDSSLATATPETLDAAAILSAIDGIRNGNPTYVVDLAQDEGVVAVGESDYGDSFFEEGAYHIAVWEPAAYGESGTGIWATDFYAEVDTELVQDDLGWSSHGLMFRWTGAWDGDWESGAGYRYAIDGLGYAQLGTGYFDDRDRLDRDGRHQHGHWRRESSRSLGARFDARDAGQ